MRTLGVSLRPCYLHRNAEVFVTGSGVVGDRAGLEGRVAKQILAIGYMSLSLATSFGGIVLGGDLSSTFTWTARVSARWGVCWVRPLFTNGGGKQLLEDCGRCAKVICNGQGYL